MPKQLGEHDRDKMHAVHKPLITNANSVESTREDVSHGLLAITQELDTYHTLAGHVFMEPTNPGATPVVPGGVKDQQEEILKDTHKENLQVCKECRNVSQALMQQLMNDIEPQHLRHFNNSHARCNYMTVRAVLG